MTFDEVRFEALGSACHVLGVGLERGRLAWATAWVAERHDRFSRFEPDSELSRFNAAAGRWTDVSPELEGLLRAALDAHRLSGGLRRAGHLGSEPAHGHTQPLRRRPAAADLTQAAAPPPPP